MDINYFKGTLLDDYSTLGRMGHLNRFTDSVESYKSQVTFSNFFAIIFFSFFAIIALTWGDAPVVGKEYQTSALTGLVLFYGLFNWAYSGSKNLPSVQIGWDLPLLNTPLFFIGLCTPAVLGVVWAMYTDHKHAVFIGVITALSIILLLAEQKHTRNRYTKMNSLRFAHSDLVAELDAYSHIPEASLYREHVKNVLERDITMGEVRILLNICKSIKNLESHTISADFSMVAAYNEKQSCYPVPTHSSSSCDCKKAD